MYQAAIREIATRYNLFVTDPMVEDMNTIIMERVPAPSTDDMQTRIDELAAEVSRQEGLVAELQRQNALITGQRNANGSLIDTIRQRVREFLKEQVDDNDFDKNDANSLLAAIGAEQLVTEWEVSMTWGSYDNIATATVWANSEQEAIELARERWDIDSAQIVVEFQFNDTDEVDWETTSTEHAADWDGDISDYIEFSAEESN